MALNELTKKSLLAVALISGTAGVAAWADTVNARPSVSLPYSAAEQKEQTGDDMKLSPTLFRLKERAKANNLSGQKSAAQENQLNMRVDVDVLIDGSFEQVRDELSGAGLTVNATYGNSVGGSIELGHLEALSHVAAVRRINMPELRTKVAQ